MRVQAAHTTPLNGNGQQMKPKIFIDGEHGTTGLQIRTRMAGRNDVELLSIPEAERRNAQLREDLLNSADVAMTAALRGWRPHQRAPPNRLKYVANSVSTPQRKMTSSEIPTINSIIKLNV